jgi:YVTN family beta-propeller protein
MPYQLAISPDGKWAYVGDASNDTLIIINTSTKAIEFTLQLEAIPYFIATSSDGKYVFVSHPDDNTISVIEWA